MAATYRILCAGRTSGKVGSRPRNWVPSVWFSRLENNAPTNVTSGAKQRDDCYAACLIERTLWSPCDALRLRNNIAIRASARSLWSVGIDFHFANLRALINYKVNTRPNNTTQMITPTIQNIMSTFVHFFLFVIRRNKGLEKKKTIQLFIYVFPRCSNTISGECGDK